MEDGEDKNAATETATATDTKEETPAPDAVVEGEDVVKMEIKADDDSVKVEDIDDEIIEMGDLGALKEHYDQDVQVGNKGSVYRVTLVLVKDQILFPGPDQTDEWCNLPYESLRALDSATLAFVRSVSTHAHAHARTHTPTPLYAPTPTLHILNTCILCISHLRHPSYS
jgi:hypothetical protein